MLVNLTALYDVVHARKGADLAESYSARMLEQGPRAIAQKVGEEATEVVIEAVSRPQQRERLVHESVDLLYHLVLLWVACGVEPAQVQRVIEARMAKNPPPSSSP